MVTTLNNPPGGIRMSDPEQIIQAVQNGTNRSYASGIVALAGGGQTGATLLKAQFNQVSTVATTGDSVMLPKAVAGMEIRIASAGVGNLAVYPWLGDTIDGNSANSSITVNAGTNTIGFCCKTGDWRFNF